MKILPKSQVIFRGLQLLLPVALLSVAASLYPAATDVTTNSAISGGGFSRGNLNAFTSAAALDGKDSPRIPWDQIGTETDRRYSGQSLAISREGQGVRLRVAFQKLEGLATLDGLWLDSTKPGIGCERFRVLATAVGRSGSPGHSLKRLPITGRVAVGESEVHFARDGLTEEYRVGVNGLRQDFVVVERPAGGSGLYLLLEVTGATVDTAPYGAKLTLPGGREIAYSRLHVTDATGRELPARMEAEAADRLRVLVDDADASYPVRIDPTFSDADWVSMNPRSQDANGTVNDMVTDDSGNLYIGGSFTVVGGIQAKSIAKWDGSSWSALGTGIDGAVYALAISEGKLYAGGMFTSAGGTEAHNIAQWNGETWSQTGLGAGGGVWALEASGSSIYAGGHFTMSGSSTSIYLAKWIGSSWIPVPGLLDKEQHSLHHTVVTNIAIAGESIYASGFLRFEGQDDFGGSRVWHSPLARFDTEWKHVPGAQGTISALEMSPNGLYVGGEFPGVGHVTVTPTPNGDIVNYEVNSRNIAIWTGSSWTGLGSGIEVPVTALKMHDGKLFVAAGGQFYPAPGVMIPQNRRLSAIWNGSWERLATSDYVYSGDTGEWISTGGKKMELLIYAFAAVDGHIVSAGYGGTAAGLSIWRDGAWRPLDAENPGHVHAVSISGSDLFIGGSFTAIGGVPANNIARWDGNGWRALGDGIDGPVYALAEAGTSIGGEGRVFAGGAFTTAGGVSANHIAKFDPSSGWQGLGDGLSGNSPVVRALAVKGTDLFAAGEFTAAGGNPAGNIARWNGSAWSPLGAGLDGPARSLAMMGGDLYVGGDFIGASAVVANGVARWNGSSWAALGGGVGGVLPSVHTLLANGTDLYAGGSFTTAGGGTANRIAKWNGSSWSALGAGLDGPVSALAMSGASLYVGGRFSTGGGMVANRIARWNEGAWSPLGSGLDGTAVNALAISGMNLYVGGHFKTAGGKDSINLALADLAGRPLMVVSGNSVGIANGDSSPNLADHTDFDTVPVMGVAVSRTFTILNTGRAELDLTGSPRIAIIGANAADFTISSMPALSLAPDAATAFMIEFRPGAPGLRSAMVVIPNSDPDRSFFTFSIQGTGSGPKIEITGNDLPISNEDTTPSADDHTYFGSVSTAAITSRTFGVKNVGNQPLVLTSPGTKVSIYGLDADDFSVESGPAPTLLPNESTTFRIRFSPRMIGPRNATIAIASNDSLDHPFTFAIRGDGDPAYALTIHASGGTVLKDPPLSAFPYGHLVTLTALPAEGNSFLGWRGALSGNANPASLNIYGDTAITAIFGVPLPVALDATELTWTASASGTWFGQTGTTRDGEDAAQSGSTGNGQESWMETTVVGPGAINFWWKVSSESNYDWLEFYLDGTLQTGRISGNVDWQRKTYPLASGSHVLRWRYVKDGGVTGGSDAAWVDQVIFERPPYTLIVDARGGSVAVSPQKAGYDHGETVTLTATPAEGGSFLGWHGSLAGLANPVTLTMDANKTVTASFTLPLPPALDAEELTWTTDGNRNWSGQTATTHDGVDAAQSGAIVHNQQAWMETTVSGPGTLSFWWRVSSENNYDWLEFYLDGALQTGRISGNVDWQMKTYSLGAGNHTLSWRYAKDGSQSSGSDAAWVDEVSWTPGGGFESWAATHFAPAQLEDLDISGPDADPDRDGRINLLEWAFGTLPTDNSDAGTVRLSGNTVMQPGNPATRILTSPAFSAHAVFCRRPDYALSRLNYTISFSADLETWEVSAAIPVVLSSDGVVELCSVPFPATVGGRAPRFFRLRVETSL